MAISSGGLIIFAFRPGAKTRILPNFFLFRCLCRRFVNVLSGACVNSTGIGFCKVSFGVSIVEFFKAFGSIAGAGSFKVLFGVWRGECVNSTIGVSGIECCNASFGISGVLEVRKASFGVSTVEFFKAFFGVLVALSFLLEAKTSILPNFFRFRCLCRLF